MLGAGEPDPDRADPQPQPLRQALIAFSVDIFPDQQLRVRIGKLGQRLPQEAEPQGQALPLDQRGLGLPVPPSSGCSSSPTKRRRSRAARRWASIAAV